jgi:hypothetical protein
MEKIDLLESYLTGMRSSFINEAEQAMLDRIATVIKNFKAIRVLGDSSNTLPANHGEYVDRANEKDRNAASSLRNLLSDFNAKHGASCMSMREPRLEFKVRTVLAPDFDWLEETDERGPLAGEGLPRAARVRAARRTRLPQDSNDPHAGSFREEG